MSVEQGRFQESVLGVGDKVPVFDRWGDRRLAREEAARNGEVGGFVAQRDCLEVVHSVTSQTTTPPCSRA
jgi:hypothetical protein